MLQKKLESNFIFARLLNFVSFPGPRYFFPITGFTAMDGSRGSPVGTGLGGFGTVGSGSVGTGQSLVGNGQGLVGTGSGMVTTGIGMAGTGIGTGSGDAGGSVDTGMGDNFHQDPRL